jgi:peroxiredoxin
MTMNTPARLSIGDPAPDFAGLPGVDGRPHALADYAGAKGLVVIFSCNHCPYVQAYEDRLIALQAATAAAGIRFVAINANDATGYPDDDFDHMVIRAREKKFNFDYVRDESQEVARAYGAAHTPQVFVFDGGRALFYTGKIDDNWREPEKVTRQYLREALEALIAGRALSEPVTPAIGCTIKWKSAAAR